jgi:hypothetical protein
MIDGAARLGREAGNSRHQWYSCPTSNRFFLSDINPGKQKGGFSYVSNTNSTNTSCNRLQRFPQREELLVEDFRN